MIQDAYESEDFNATPVLTPKQESHYLQAYLPLVRKVVRQLAPQCTCVMDRQDMEQTALMGLLNAIRRYGQPDEGFAGYAVPKSNMRTAASSTSTRMRGIVSGRPRSARSFAAFRPHR